MTTKDEDPTAAEWSPPVSEVVATIPGEDASAFLVEAFPAFPDCVRITWVEDTAPAVLIDGIWEYACDGCGLAIHREWWPAIRAAVDGVLGTGGDAP